MTEQDWLTGTNPFPLLTHAGGDPRYYGRFPHHRKWRLYFCACCRRFWHLLPGPRSRQAIEVSEQCADGLVGEEGLVQARVSAYQAATQLEQERRDAGASGPPDLGLRASAADVAALAAEPELEMLQDIVYRAWGVMQRDASGPDWETAVEREQAYQAELIRDIIGNPFRPVEVAPAWLMPAVRSLAQAVYDDRALDRLPILADALEEAGCSSREALAHLRGPGPHVRGCWVVDLLLGKS
jgi:hypothetical protein